MALNIDFTDKVVLVTGVSSGIGLGTAIQFAKAGANVAGCSRKKEGSPRANAFVEAIEKENRQALYVEADVTKLEDLENLVNKVIEKFGRLDFLFSNAGMNVFKGAKGCEEGDWQYNLDLNLASHWRLAKLCKPYLEKSEDGVIILMTSNHAYSTLSGCFPYNVTKSAIVGLVKSLAIEWGPSIRTVGIAPGFVDTKGNDEWFASFPDPEKERERTIALHPVKKLGTVEEIGQTCVFLASPMAAFISGTVILVDGGRSALMQDD